MVMTVLAGFLWRRWQFILYIRDLLSQGYQPGRETNLLSSMHNTNLAGCRKHPVIYNDMFRIVRGMKYL